MWWLVYTILLTLNDILSFGLVKSYALHRFAIGIGMIVPMVLYSLQMPLFYLGLQHTSMAILNISWNLASNILVTLVGIFYFREQITHMKTAAILLALSSLGLFALDTYVVEKSS